MDFSLLVNFSLAMLAIVNPFGIIPAWLLACRGATPAASSRLIVMMMAMAFIVLAAAMVGGRPFLRAIGIDIPAFSVGGGIVLFSLSFSMLSGKAMEFTYDPEDGEGTALEQAKSRFNKIIFPMAVPLIAGPGTIITAVIYGARVDSVLGYLLMLSSLLIILALAGVVLYLSPVIRHWVGDIFLEIQTRLFGILLAGIAAHLVLNGIADALPLLSGGG